MRTKIGRGKRLTLAQVCMWALNSLEKKKKLYSDSSHLRIIKCLIHFQAIRKIKKDLESN